ncbi:MAG TPA: polysaccharide deacetylase family protein [Xanthobacteraceae bacterium]|nr:polysaccharide deacetylase family protein [Xanthobacteraceae bacterium]
MLRTGAVCFVLALWAGTPTLAAECPGNPDAIGTSRVIAVDPTEHTRIGTMQYPETLPLADHEVVLTFDDGPLPPSTNRILDILASQCVKATYFIIGRMARAFPDTLRHVAAAGHTIGTHTENHPLFLNRLPLERAEQEVDEGIASVVAALGDPKEVAPFVRIPGLSRTQALEQYLGQKGIMVWSADFPADDWKHISAAEITKRALSRLEAKGKGVLLLHDIHPATAQALPVLLRELKKRGYHIVHVVPASADHPKTATLPEQWLMHPGKPPEPPVVGVDLEGPAPVLPVPAAREFVMIRASAPKHAPRRAHAPESPLWPAVEHAALSSEAELPVPGPQSFGYSESLQPVIPAVITHSAGHFSLAAPRPRPARHAATRSVRHAPRHAATRNPPRPADEFRLGPPEWDGLASP